MPLFSAELNQLADRIQRAAWTVRLHTAAPSDASPDNGLVTVGGGSYESGFAITTAQIDRDADGDLTINVACAFGEADEDVGTVTHYSIKRGTDNVSWDAFASGTTINDGDTFTIPANTIMINGTTT